MSSPPRPVVVISCFILERMMRQLLPPSVLERTVFLDYALHVRPTLLLEKLQQLMDGLPEPSLVVLGYGLCGNGTVGLKTGPHSVLIPRVDDCIAMLLGSRRRYEEEFQAFPGTYYLTKGWLESASNPLLQYLEYQQKYDEETATWLMDQQYANYRRLVFVGQSEDEIRECRPEARKVAEYCARWGMEYEEKIGSDEFVAHLVGAALGRGTPGPDLLLLGPGETVTQEMFRTSDQ